MEEKEQLELGNRLLLLQGIYSIQNGLDCLEWISGGVSKIGLDALTILQDRFLFFKECALDGGKNDFFIISQVNESIKDVQSDHESIQSIKSELTKIKRKAVLILSE